MKSTSFILTRETNLKATLRCLLVCSFLFVFAGINAQNELDVLKNNWLQFTDAPNSLYHHLAAEAYKLLDKRTDAILELGTLNEWQMYQSNVKKTLNDIVGPFPAKTPLNAHIIKTINKDFYRVENIVFESQPGFFVTSSMFLPGSLKKGSKAPAIIYCSGHSADGYRSAVYQHVILNLVKKGFIVFAFDPVGQGERMEYWDAAKGKSVFNGPTIEHSVPGSQLFITGSSLARYMIWDGIRAIDYLITRKEIDPARIGITGRSGGGTLSAYIAAFDDRIYAAAPENYITNFKRLFQSIGPQDAEQNLFNGISNGIDHPDFLIVRAPKPAIMITTTRDMFSIQGAMETEKEVAKIYKVYGKEMNFSRVEDDAPHASTEKNRVAMYRFFQDHLNNPGNAEDEEIKILTATELQVTPTGQVSTSFPGAETIFDLNRIESERLFNSLHSPGNTGIGNKTGLADKIKKLSGYREPAEVPEPVFAGRIGKDGYVIEKYFVKGEGDYMIPYLVFRPGKPSAKYILYLHPAGKSAEAQEGGEISFFVKNGCNVIAPDLVGTGETGTGNFRGDANIDRISHNIWYASILIGRSITGILAGDVVRLVKVIRRENGSAVIYGLAKNEMSPVLLHAAIFEPAISRVGLISPFSSFRSIVMNRFYKSAFILSAVPGALSAYDLPDLEASLAPVKLLIAGQTDGNGELADLSDIEKDIALVRSGYQNKNAAESLDIIMGDISGRLKDIYAGWIR
jgi:hypothetical protein